MKHSSKHILIATGVYPPQHGGPSYYAKNLKDEFENIGYVVVVKTYGIERSLPIGIRHGVYFLKTLPAFIASDFVLVLDTFSVGFPIALLNTLFKRCVILRTGGDFLWEQYVERTKETILLSDFYRVPRQYTSKEKIIFALTAFVLRHVSRVVFSTVYQRDIWMQPYGLSSERVSIIENRYEPVGDTAHEKIQEKGEKKHFVYAAARQLVWKNAPVAEAACAIAQKSVPEVELDFLFDMPRDKAIEKIKHAYAVVLTSLGDISPNYILRALSLGKPVILTTENGLRDRIGDAALYVNPLDTDAVAQAFIALCDPVTYGVYQTRVQALSFTHTYADIANEFLRLFTTI